MARTRTTATRDTAHSQFTPRADRQRVERTIRAARVVGWVLLVTVVTATGWVLYAAGERGAAAQLVHDLALIVTVVCVQRFWRVVRDRERNRA
jgi:hypothetical protein